MYSEREEMIYRENPDQFRLIGKGGYENVDEFQSYYANYEKSLRYIDDCFNNLQLSTTQTSYIFAAIKLMFEIEYFITKMNLFFKIIDNNPFIAFCCNVNFREWAKKMHLYSNSLNEIEGDKLVTDEMYLHPFEISPYLFSFTTYCQADEETIDSLMNSLKPQNDQSRETKKILKKFSEEMIPEIEKFRDRCEIDCVSVIKEILCQFGDYLQSIYNMINSVCLNNFKSISFGFDIDRRAIEDEVSAFVEANENRKNFLQLVKNKIKNLYNDKASKYCSEEEWHTLFEQTQYGYYPDYKNIGELLFRYKNKDEKLKVARDIVRFMIYWMEYRYVYFKYEKFLHDNKIEPEDASPLDIPEYLLDYILIEDKYDLKSFIDLIKIDAKKLCEKTGCKDFWDYFYFICIDYKLLRMKPYNRKCSRKQFAKILSYILYGSDEEAERIRFMMEKSGLQATMPDKAIKKAKNDKVGLIISKLLEEQGFKKN